MRELHSKISYLQGLAEGLDLDTASKEGRILANILDILGDMAETVTELGNAQVELENYVETIDEDLSELEDDFYDDLEDDDELDYVEVECPNCHDLVYFNPNILDSEDDTIEICCPNCNEVVFQSGDEFDENEE